MSGPACIGIAASIGTGKITKITAVEGLPKRGDDKVAKDFLREDDSDIKIFTDEESQKPIAADDPDLMAKKVEEQRAKGNIQRARDLGVRLSDALVRQWSQSDPDFHLDPQVLQQQKKLLYAYCVKIGLEAFCLETLLATTALNVFMEEIDQQDQILYKDIHRSQAFSLYLLCTRLADQRDYAIGRVFAKLCEKENDAPLVKYGQMQYDQYMDFVNEQVLACHFK